MTWILKTGLALAAPDASWGLTIMQDPDGSCGSEKYALPSNVFDNHYVQKWCGTSAKTAYGQGFIESQQLLSSNWDKGFGWDEVIGWDGWDSSPTDVCYPDNFLGRTVNALVLIDEVTKTPNKLNAGPTIFGTGPDLIAKLDGMESFEILKAVKMLEAQSAGWLNYVQVHAPGMQPDCDWGDAVATNPGDPDDRIELHGMFAYQYSVSQRASTLVHEATHEYFPHGAGLCYAAKSCDTYFGGFNATSAQIAFLLDAASAMTDQVAQYADPLTGSTVCSHVPLLVEGLRADAMNLVNAKLSYSFNVVYPVKDIPTLDQVNAAMGQNWLCGGKKVCTAADYAAGTPNACPETGPWATHNKAINQSRQGKCTAFNLVAQGTTTLSQLSKLHVDFLKEISESYAEGCYKPTSVAEVSAVCDARIASSTKVSALNSDGALDAFNFGSKCEKKFCHQKFDAAFWSANDPLTTTDSAGCIEAVCGPVTGVADAAYLKEIQTCRKTYVAAKGDPYWYMAPEEEDQCKAAELSCVASSTQSTTSYGGTTLQLGTTTSCLSRAHCYGIFDFMFGKLFATPPELEVTAPDLGYPVARATVNEPVSTRTIARTVIQDPSTVPSLLKSPAWRGVASDPEFLSQIRAASPSKFQQLGSFSTQVVPAP